MDFCFTKSRKTIHKNYFFGTIFENNYQIEELIVKLATRIDLNLMKWLAKRD